MNTTTRISTTERLGHRLGRGWRAYARGERRVSAWLASQGLPAAGATVLLWIVKLGALAAMFYAALWVVLPLAVAFAAVAGLGAGENKKMNAMDSYLDPMDMAGARYGRQGVSGGFLRDWVHGENK
jgi:hypothetical protein